LTRTTIARRRRVRAREHPGAYPGWATSACGASDAGDAVRGVGVVGDLRDRRKTARGAALSARRPSMVV